MKKKIVASVLSMSLLCSLAQGPVVVKADAKSDLQKKIEENIKRAKEINNKATNLSEQEKKAQSELDGILTKIGDVQKNIASIQGNIDIKNQEIEAKSSSINQTNKTINIKNSEIAEKEVEIVKKEDEFLQKNAVLDAKLRSSYKNDATITKISMLLDSKTFSDFINRVKVIALIIREDNRLINEIKADKAEIENTRNNIVKEKENFVVLKNSLETQKSELDSAKAKLVEEKDKLDKVNAELALLQNEKNSVIASLKSQSGELKLALSSIDDQNKDFNNKIAAITEAERLARIKAEQEAARIRAEQEAARIRAEEEKKRERERIPVPSKSGFIKPTSGYITSWYGTRVDPVTGVLGTFHSGIDIANGIGTPIVAAMSGTVVLAGWNGNYGQCVIIDHGNGFVTRYGHLSSISVNEGQTVSQGQYLGGMGSTGKSTGSHLHFEIRIGNRYSSSSVNPSNYLGF